jgi:secreted trypsin-like serine protease
MKFALVVLACAVAAVSGLPRELAPHGWEKIVGGVEATPHEFPWMVDMRQGGHYCGASIIHEEWVMTAAHCSTGSPSNYELVAGDHHIGQTEGTEQRRQVTRIIRHPGYGSGVQYENDIALMKVEPPFQFNQYVQPANVPNITFLPTERAIVAGWGALSEGGGSPVVLMKVDVPMVSDEQCRVAYGAGAVADSMICSGEGGKDSCQGDSGGPKMCERDGVLWLCGIVSWGRGCARPDFPGVYTEVSYFEDWAFKAILPPVESNDSWVEQREGCGGVLSGSSGYVAYKLGGQAK